LLTFHVEFNIIIIKTEYKCHDGEERSLHASYREGLSPAESSPMRLGPVRSGALHRNER